MTGFPPRVVFGALAALVVLTRALAFGSVHHVPDATLAAFFLLGALVPARLALLGLIALRMGLTVVALAARGDGWLCISPTYAAMPIAYAVMWQVGRGLAARGAFTLRRGPIVAAGLLTASALAFGLTSGAYHFLSGHVADPTLASFGERVAAYAPAYLWAPVPYVLVALAIGERVARLRSATAESTR